MESRVSKSKKLEIYWFTISYKQLLAWGGAIVLVGALGGFAFKDYLFEIQPVSGSRQCLQELEHEEEWFVFQADWNCESEEVRCRAVGQRGFADGARRG
jgi:hypothetical protein